MKVEVEVGLQREIFCILNRRVVEKKATMKTFSKVQTQGTSQLKIRYVECQILKIGSRLKLELKEI